jgi:hypothetical protein
MNITTSPVNFDCLQLMDIMIEVEAAIGNKQCNISDGIRQNITKGTPARKIVKQLKEMAEDNYGIMFDLFGGKLTKKILAV